MKSLYSLLLIISSQIVMSQDVLSIVFEQSVPVFAVRSSDNAPIDELKPNDLIYIEPSSASIVKIQFYSKTQNGWREGFVEQKFIQTISSSTKADKIRFSVSYLKDFVKLSSQNKLSSDYLANNFNLLIDDFLELSCQHKNPPVTKLFVQSLFSLYYTYDEKHLYALEELFHCQKGIFNELLYTTDSHTKQKINEYIKEWK